MGEILIRNVSGAQSWAHARLLGSALSALGATVARVTEGPSDTRGMLVARAPGLDAASLEQQLETLRRDPAMRAYLQGIAVEPLSADERRALRTEPLQDVTIALFGSAGAPYHQLDVFASAGFDVAPIGSAAVRSGALEQVDVFVMPGGGWEFMDGQLRRLGVDGAKMVRSFVESGGCYLSSCAGTHSILQQPAGIVPDWHPAYGEMPKLSAESWLKGERSSHYVRSPGIGVIRVRPNDKDHLLVLGLPDEFDCVYYNGPIILPADAGYTSILDCVAPEPKRFTPGEGLFGNDPVRLEDTAMAEAGRKHHSAGGMQPLAAGWVVGFGLHPEFGCDPTMLDWGVAARLLVNAAEWTTAQSGSPEAKSDRASFDPSGWSATSDMSSPGQVHAVALAHLRDIEARFDVLSKMPAAEIAPWLDRDIARSAFGLTPEEIWTSTLAKGAQLSREMMERLEIWAGTCEQSADLSGGASEPVKRRAADLRENALRVMALPAVDAERQDLGFKGLTALLSDVKELLETLSADGEFLPFKAVAMSYLGAFGRLTAASLTLSASQAMLVRARMMAELSLIAARGATAAPATA